MFGVPDVSPQVRGADRTPEVRLQSWYDAGSCQLPANLPTAITCLQVLQTPGYGTTPSTAAAVGGSLSSRTLHFAHLIGRKTGSAKRPVVSASPIHSWRSGKRVTAWSCERPRAAWKLTRNRRQGTVELRVQSILLSLVSGAQITSRLNRSTATSGSGATNYAICFSSRRHRRKQCFFRIQKAERGPQLPQTEVTHHGVAACHSQKFHQTCSCQH